MTCAAALPQGFLRTPIAHRGLHDASQKRPENSLAAATAAVDAGYPIELDLQLSRDDIAMVFHDPVLDRLTSLSGKVRSRSAQELQQIPLRNGTECIPTLRDFLSLIAGRVPLLIELKDQSGNLGPAPDALADAVASHLTDYKGDVAVMSFNPHSVARFGTLMPAVPRGLVTENFLKVKPNGLSHQELTALTRMEHYDAVGASFISHAHTDLTSPEISRAKDRGADVLCWTVRSPAQETEARKYAQNITFEGYAPALPYT